MAERTPTKKKRLGRPPDTDSADTQRRILDQARAAFATVGYDGATNRELADAVGVTAGALYHYFGSKLDLYTAVYDDVQQLVYARYHEAAAAESTFLDKFDAVLDAAHELTRHDPTVAAFVGSARTEIRRNPEIAAALGPDAARRDAFFIDLIDAGVEAGEIPRAQRSVLIAFVMTYLRGLSDADAADTERHLRAVNAMKLALRGQLGVAARS